MPASAAACSKSTAVQRASARSMAARACLRPAGSQQGQRAVAVVGKLAWMRTPAAIAAAIRARDGVVGIQRDAVDAEVAAAFLRRVQHVDADLLARAAAQMPDLGGGSAAAAMLVCAACPTAKDEGRTGSAPVSTHAPALHRACRPRHSACRTLRDVVPEEERPSGRTGGGPSDFPWRQSSCGGLRSDYIAKVRSVNTRTARACFMV